MSGVRSDRLHLLDLVIGALVAAAFLTGFGRSLRSRARELRP